MAGLNLPERDGCAVATVSSILQYLVINTMTLTSIPAANNDDFISRLRLLKFGRQKVLQKMGSYWECGHPSNPYSVY